jgi:hypothetical protein
MKNVLIFLFSVTVVFSACKRNIQEEEPTPTGPVTMDDLVVNSDFDWKTTVDYELSITSSANNIVEVVSMEGTVYQRAFISAGQTYVMKLTLPSYTEKVKVKFMGKEKEVELTSEIITCVFE